MVDSKNISKGALLFLFVIFSFIIGLILGRPLDISSGGMSHEGFIELYFDDIESLPRDMQQNMTYPLSFTVVSHEPESGEFRYAVSSDIYNATGTFTLSPQESKQFSLILQAPALEYELQSKNIRQWDNRLDIPENSWIGYPIPLDEILVSNSSHPNPSEIHHLPLSTNVDSFGSILFSNISLRELQHEPFIKRYSFFEENEDMQYHRNTVITLSVEGDELLLTSLTREETYVMETTEGTLSIVITSPRGEDYSIQFEYIIGA